MEFSDKINALLGNIHACHEEQKDFEEKKQQLERQKNFWLKKGEDFSFAEGKEYRKSINATIKVIENELSDLKSRSLSCAPDPKRVKEIVQGTMPSVHSAQGSFNIHILQHNDTKQKMEDASRRTEDKIDYFNDILSFPDYLVGD